MTKPKGLCKSPDLGSEGRPLPCPCCGHQKESIYEPDGCLGLLPGVVSACCGHGGVKKSYIEFSNGVNIVGFEIRRAYGLNWHPQQSHLDYVKYLAQQINAKLAEEGYSGDET